MANVKFCFVIKVHIIANCIREEGAPSQPSSPKDMEESRITWLAQSITPEPVGDFSWKSLEEVINDYISDADSEPIQESYDKHNMPYLILARRRKRRWPWRTGSGLQMLTSQNLKTFRVGFQNPSKRRQGTKVQTLEEGHASRRDSRLDSKDHQSTTHKGPGVLQTSRSPHMERGRSGIFMRFRLQ